MLKNTCSPKLFMNNRKDWKTLHLHKPQNIFIKALLELFARPIISEDLYEDFHLIESLNSQKSLIFSFLVYNLSCYGLLYNFDDFWQCRVLQQEKVERRLKIERMKYCKKNFVLWYFQ